MLPAEKFRRRKRPSGSIGCSAPPRRGGRAPSSTYRRPAAPSRRARPAQTGLLDQREDRPAETERARAARRGSRSAAAPSRAGPARDDGQDQSDQAMHEGDIHQEDQRQEASASSSPPASGPSTPAIAPMPSSCRSRPAALLAAEGVDDHRQRARNQQRPRHALQRAGATSKPMHGATAQSSEATPKPETPSAKIRRSPYRSPSEPPIRISEPSVSR